MIFTNVDYEINEDLMSMEVNLKNSSNGITTVDLNAELFQDIHDELYVCAINVRRKDTNLNYYYRFR